MRSKLATTMNVFTGQLSRQNRPIIEEGALDTASQSYKKMSEILGRSNRQIKFSRKNGDQDSASQ